MGPLFHEIARQAGAYTPRLVSAAVILGAFWIAAALARGILRRWGDRAEPHRRDLYALLAQAIWLAAWAVAIIMALGTLQVDVSALVAGLGLTGFALGFALKDAISNLLAGVMLLFYRPFRRGDRVAVTGVEGEVTEVNLRYTIISGGDRTYLIPNSLLLSNTITLTPRDPLGDAGA